MQEKSHTPQKDMYTFVYWNKRGGKIIYCTPISGKCIITILLYQQSWALGTTCRDNAAIFLL